MKWRKDKIKYNNYLDFSDEELQTEQIQMYIKQVENVCCSFCGSMLVVKKVLHDDSTIQSVTAFCPRCKRPEVGTHIDSYINRLKILVNHFYTG